MSETVRVEFEPPNECQETEKSWRLYAEGKECLSLPKSHTQYLEWDGKTVKAAIISRWLAEKEGLTSTSSFQESDGYQEEQAHDNMSRHDWFYLGMAMAMVIRGDVSDQAVVHEAYTLAERLFRR